MDDPSKPIQTHLDYLESLIKWGYPLLILATTVLYLQPAKIEERLSVKPFHVSTLIWLSTLAMFTLVYRTLECLVELVEAQPADSTTAIQTLRTYPTVSNPFFESTSGKTFLSVFGACLLVAPSVAVLFIGGDSFYRFGLPVMTPKDSGLIDNPDWALLFLSYLLGQGSALCSCWLGFLSYKRLRWISNRVSSTPQLAHTRRVAMLIAYSVPLFSLGALSTWRFVAQFP